MKTKKTYPFTFHIEAYSPEDAQAKGELLLQMGAFLKDFNVGNLAGSLLKSCLTTTAFKIAGEIMERKKKEATASELLKLGNEVLTSKTANKEENKTTL